MNVVGDLFWAAVAGFTLGVVLRVVAAGIRGRRQ